MWNTWGIMISMDFFLQESRYSNANTLEFRPFCTNPTICDMIRKISNANFHACVFVSERRTFI